MCFVQVNLGDDFHWSMHAQNWNTDIDGVNIQLSDVFSNSAAAALVNFTKFTELPYNVCIVEDCTNFACEFSVAVVGAALTACTCVFNNTYTVVDEGRVLFFISICKVNRFKSIASILI